jgi:hypothetical protein
MRRVHGLATVALATFLIQVATIEARAAVIYDYRGTEFTFCGHGCPEFSPPNWEEDYVIASLTFDAPLAPNLTFDDEVRTGLVSYTETDKLGSFFLTGTALPDSEDDGVIIPGLKLATDANGNITSWFMVVDDPSHVWLTNPPFVCPPGECVQGFADYAGINLGSGDDWWEATSQVPGAWSRRAEVPEPATLALGLVAVGGFAVRQRRRFLARR